MLKKRTYRSSCLGNVSIDLNFTISKVEDEKLNCLSRNELSFIVLILKEFYKSNISYKRVCSTLCSLQHFLRFFDKLS